jgi:hypothetical protein
MEEDGMPDQITTDLVVRRIPPGLAGAVQVESSAGRRLAVTGPGIPSVRVERVETPRERAHREKRAAKGKPPVTGDRHAIADGSAPFTVPDAFTRDRQALVLTVADARAKISPRRVFVIRATYGVRAEAAGRRYLLAQTSWFRAKVVRDGRVVARLRRLRRGGLPYEDDVRWMDADPLDVAMTHTLATAYRVGSPGFVYNLLAAGWYAVYLLITLVSMFG